MEDRAHDDAFAARTTIFCSGSAPRAGRTGIPPSRRPPGGGEVTTPLYKLKAEFFKTLGHPARIRVLELLSEREHAVAEMLPEVGIEPANLSQQLAVLRRANLVVARKEGSSVYYSLTSPHVAELLAVARRILTGVLSGQAVLLEDLQASAKGRGAVDTGRATARMQHEYKSLGR
jgi:ArsR family transcriptional regulator